VSLPALDAAKCTACGDCVALCPAACLAMLGPLPWLPRPADCVVCGVCELVCLTGAIVLPAVNLSKSPPVERVESGADPDKTREARKA
jgi:MinD superfamily P-loop ATPase